MQLDILSTITTVLAGVAAAFIQLPQPWAHIAAGSITAGIGAMHITNSIGSKPTVTASFWKGKSNG